MKRFLIIFLIFYLGKSFGYFPISLFRYFDVNLRRDHLENERFRLSFLSENSVNVTGRNSEKHEVNILQIWNKNQDALTMIRGFCPNSAIGMLATKLNSVNDNGTRGHLIPLADFKANEIALNASFYLPRNFSLNFFLPFYSMHLKNISFTDLTEDLTAQDILVKENLTNDFFNLVRNLGGLNLSPWQKSGIGDLIGTIEWSAHFPQSKPWLKDVQISVRGGVSFPSGLKKDEDLLFSVPFGNDGSWGVLVGGGLDLTWGRYVKTGIDFQFEELFGSTKCRRIKTDKDQTDLLLLAKTEAFLEPGFLQRYNLYFEIYEFIHGLSFRLAYQNLKKTDGVLSFVRNDFDSETANTAESLQEWVIHQLLFVLNYDFSCNVNNSTTVPNISLFYKFPFNGKRAVLDQTVGIVLSLSF